MSTALLSPLWDIEPKDLIDESTDEWRDVETPSTVEPANQTTIKIKVDDKSNFLLFSEARLQLDVEVKCTSNSGVIQESDGVCLPNPWLLFKTAILSINSTVINGTISDPGIAYHMNNLARYSKDTSDSLGDVRGFYPLAKRDHGGFVRDIMPEKQPFPGENTTAVPGITANGTFWTHDNDPTAEFQQEVCIHDFVATNDFYASYGRIRRNPYYDPVYARACKRIQGNAGKFTVQLPLHELYPVLRDCYNRVNKGSTMELTLSPINVNNIANAFYCANNTIATDTAEVLGLSFVINKASIWVPVLRPSLEYLSKIEAQIASQSELVENYELNEYQSYSATPGATSRHIQISPSASRLNRVIVAFSRDEQQTSLTRNPVQFEAFQLENLSLKVNQHQFPVERFETGTATGGKSGFVRLLNELYRGYGKSGYDYDVGSVVNYESFVNGCQTLYVFDLTNMPQDAFRAGGNMVVDLFYKFTSSPGSVTVHTLITSQARLESSLINGTILLKKAR